MKSLVFTLIHENKLKVILSSEDMSSLGLDCARMDYSDPDSRKAMSSILEEGRSRVRFDTRGAKLFVEAYPCDGGGCVLYFTCLRPTCEGAGTTQPVLFEFDGVNDLTLGAAKVFERYGRRIYRSSLYRLNGRYRLIMYPLDYSDRLSVYFLCEYGSKLGEGELLAAFTEEHGDELIRDDAIELLAEFFGG